MQHIEDVKEYWNLRAKGFSDAVEEELSQESAEEWREIFQKTIGTTSLDVLDDGMGPGFFTVILNQLGHRVTAIDYSEQMIEQAKRRFRQMKIDAKVMQMDAQNLKFADESFDVVVSRNVIWNLDDPSRAYNEMYRVLRPGGKIIVSDGNMYLYHHDEAYAKERERYMQLQETISGDEGLHRKHNKDRVDFSIIEKIAEDLPMSYERRPQWDFNELIMRGFYDVHVSVNGGKLPQGFIIIAEKRSLPRA